MKSGSMTQDSICDRIQWLTESYLEQIAIDGDNWSALFKDPHDGRYWELTYPQSHMQGGGPPTLQLLSKEAVFKKYPKTKWVTG